MRFAPIPARISAVDACEQAIREAILRGELEVGSRLPPERRMAESFGVNRVTVRSALARLETHGLLRVRQGSGYVVRDFRRTGGLELLRDLVDVDPTRASELVEDLFQVRRQLAALVFERLIGAELSEVSAAIDRFETVAAEGDDLAIARADLDVLAALLEATGSRVLQLCFNPVTTVVFELPELRAAMYATPQDNVAGYRALLEWASSKRPEVDVMLAVLEARDARTLRFFTQSMKSSKANET